MVDERMVSFWTLTTTEDVCRVPPLLVERKLLTSCEDLCLGAVVSSLPLLLIFEIVSIAVP